MLSHNRVVGSNFAILALVFLSTPGISVMQTSGNLDALCIGLLVLAFCHIFQVSGRKCASTLAAILVFSVIIFNGASKLYIQQQQHYLSIETLYLTTEIFSLIETIASWKLTIGVLAALLTLILLFSLASKIVLKRRLYSVITASMLLAGALGLQFLYTEITEEEWFDASEATPLGHLIRSTGALPFVKFDHEWVANQKRQAIVSKLLNNPTASLPDEYSRASIYPLLGRKVDQHSDHKPSRYPLHNSFAPNANKIIQNKPNVLILVLESVRASEMGIYGAESSATPFLDTLAAENVFVPNFYATSNFTVKSEHAIHCSSYDFMIGAPLASRNIPVRSQCLPDTLRNHGYQTVWFHGNDKKFYDRDHYLPKLGFNQLFSSEELNSGKQLPTMGWGITDHALFDSALEKLELINGPFYSEILSVSNHLPFDYSWGIEFPEHLSKKSTMFERYRRGIYYTDQAVKSFYKKFKKSSISEDTILIITGDHGIWTFSDNNKTNLQKNEEYFRIPLILELPGYKKAKIEGIHSHLDIAPTLLELLKLEPNSTYIGHSIFSDSDEKSDRVLYMTTEQALSYRYKNKACMPNTQCQNSIDCYKQGEAKPTQTQCFAMEEGYDLLLGIPMTSPVVNPDLIDDRLLFDYTQIALELGSTPSDGLTVIRSAAAASAD